MSPHPTSPPSPPRTVVLADDHQRFRQGLARAIEEHEALELVAEVDNGIDALVAIERLEPAVAVLDLEMPGLSGLEVCRRLGGERASPTRVLIVTASTREDLAVEAARAGAALLGKDASRGEICEAILALAGGRRT